PPHLSVLTRPALPAIYSLSLHDALPISQPFCLGSADGNLRLLFIRHFEHVAGLEPRHHFLDAVDVDQIRSVRAPKDVGIERGLQDRKSTRLNSSHGSISYAVFCLKKTT